MVHAFLTPLILGKDKSLFGGFRAHSDLAVLERTHEYPGPATAYDPDVYGYEADGGGKGSIAFDANTNTLAITVSDGATSAKSRLRTHDLVRYQPGCMPVINLTGASNNAWTTLKCIRRSSATGTIVDTEEATISNFNSTYENRYEIRYAYLGVQAVEWGINGNPVLYKDYSGKALYTVPYMRSPHLPLDVEIVNSTGVAGTRYLRIGIFDDSDGLFFQWELTGNFASQTFYFKCASARLAGGSEYPYWWYPYSRTLSTTAAALQPLFSIRLKSTLNGISNRSQLFPRLMTYWAETNPGTLQLDLNATLTGATWLATSPSTAVEVDTAATAVTGGTTLASIPLAKDLANAQFDLRQAFTLMGRKVRRQAFTGTSDTITISQIRESGANVTGHAALYWDELR